MSEKEKPSRVAIRVTKLATRAELALREMQLVEMKAGHAPERLADVEKAIGMVRDLRT